MNKIFNDEFVRFVVETYSDLLYKISYQHLRNKLDAEDIVQEVFYAMLEQYKDESTTNLKNWLIKVTINKSKSQYKQNLRKRSKTEKLNDNIPAETVSDEHYEVNLLLDTLSPTEREIIYLFYYEGYTTSEIAEFLGIKRGAVEKRLSRLRMKLKDILDEV